MAWLEYRGYDSAGLVVCDTTATPHNLQLVKRAGKLNALLGALDGVSLPGKIGFGHTRWATHGPPNDVNSHPHSSEDGRLALIHNGIIENHQPLREQLLGRGHTFSSDTDSEVLVHLVEEQLKVTPTDLVAAVRAALKQVEGAYAVVVTHADFEFLVAARQTSPLVIGLGDGENFLASDVTALLPHSKRVVYLLDGDVVELDKNGARTLALLNVRGSSISREADDVLYLGAGPEIGVASTKAYLAMLVSFTLLALWLGQGRGSLEDATSSTLVANLRELPLQLERVLERRSEIAAVAEELLAARSVLYLGRGVNYAATGW